MPARHRARRRLSRPFSWLTQHVGACTDAVARLRREWLATLMTTAVIGIALGLPAVFVVFVDNAERATGAAPGQMTEELDARRVGLLEVVDRDRHGLELVGDGL